MNMHTKLTCITVIGVLAMLTFASISMAYSYSSSVISSGNTITSEYLTINVYDGNYSEQPTTPSTEVVFTVKDTVDKLTIKDSVTATFEHPYSIRVSSNGVDKAYVYGYYTCSSDVGVAVRYIEMTFTDGSTAKLVKDAYACGLTADPFTQRSTDTLAALGSTHDDVNYKDYQIKSITVYYYSGLVTDKDGNITVGHGTKSVTTTESVKATDATSLSAFEFHFLTSRDSLINKTA